MLLDIAVMLFAFGLPAMMCVAFRNSEGKPTANGFVGFVAVIAVLVALICLFDCVISAREAQRSLQSIQQFGK